jgi:hypothetical protein
VLLEKSSQFLTVFPSPDSKNKSQIPEIKNLKLGNKERGQRNKYFGEDDKLPRFRNLTHIVVYTLV